MQSTEQSNDQLQSMLRRIRRLDIALAYSWAGVTISAVVLFATDFIALSWVITKQSIEAATLILINAIVGFLSLTLFVFSKRGVRRFHRMADDAAALMKATGVTITGPLSVDTDGIVARGFRGRKTTIKWADISAVVYDKGEICFFRERRRIGLCYWTNYAGLPYNLNEVAQAIMTHLPEEKWVRAKEWLTLQIGDGVRRP